MDLYYKIKEDIHNLARISEEACNQYKMKMKALMNFVDDYMNDLPFLKELIGENHPQTMWDNHKNHVYFMSSVFKYNLYNLLVTTIPWVYRAYHAHGFSYDYFPVSLKAWKLAIEKYISSPCKKDILNVYDFMIENHRDFIKLSENEDDISFPVPDRWMQIKNEFRSALLEGDHRTCLKILKENLKDHQDIEDFYLFIIQASLYDIGIMWEKGEITVAQEHLASSIVARLMAEAYSAKIEPKPFKGKAIITSAPMEFHQLGAWMLSDLLDIDGWQVRYLGANTPQKDLISAIRSFMPDILAISITMTYNISNAAEIIREMRASSDLKHIKVIVGGIAINLEDSIWKDIKADGTAQNALEAVKLANSLIS